MLTWTLQAVSPSTVLFRIENTFFLDSTEPQQESLFLLAPVMMTLRCKLGALRSVGERSVAERGLSYTCSSSSDHWAAGICLGADKRPGSRASDARAVSGADLDHVCVDRENNGVKNNAPCGRVVLLLPVQPRAATKATLSLTRPAEGRLTHTKASSRRSLTHTRCEDRKWSGIMGSTATTQGGARMVRMKTRSANMRQPTFCSTHAPLLPSPAHKAASGGPRPESLPSYSSRPLPFQCRRTPGLCSSCPRPPLVSESALVLQMRMLELLVRPRCTSGEASGAQ
jgi:hypothetical protein